MSNLRVVEHYSRHKGLRGCKVVSSRVGGGVCNWGLKFVFGSFCGGRLVGALDFQTNLSVALGFGEV
jgi:hypothetical protein